MNRAEGTPSLHKKAMGNFRARVWEESGVCRAEERPQDTKTLLHNEKQEPAEAGPQEHARLLSLSNADLACL